MCVCTRAFVCLCIYVCYWQEGKEGEQELNLKFFGKRSAPKQQNGTTAISILAQYKYTLNDIVQGICQGTYLSPTSQPLGSQIPEVGAGLIRASVRGMGS